MGIPEGAMTKFLEPLSPGNVAALQIWNRLGGELRYPDVAYEIAQRSEENAGMLLNRLHALREWTAHEAERERDRMRRR
jgi:hypothetical protein